MESHGPDPRFDIGMKRLPELVSTVRRALVLRAVIAELVLWSAVLGTTALAIALAFPSVPRWPLLAIVALAPLVGMVRARRARPSDADVVLWIDRQLAANETIVTAWEIEAPTPMLAQAIADASTAIEKARPRDVRPKVARGDAWGLLMAIATFLAAFQIPAPAPAPPGPERDVVQTTDTQALRRIERLPEELRDPEQRRRIEDAAERARELRRDLEQGLERREALDRLEGVRAAVEAARPRPTPEQRRAQDAASEALAGQQEMQRAVEERDLEALDRAVERAAARREQADREAAREALAEAARAAREAGDEALAGSLLERESLLRRRAEQAALARELAEAIGERLDRRRRAATTET